MPPNSAKDRETLNPEQRLPSNIVLTAGLLRQLDRLAHAKHLSRSATIRLLLSKALAEYTL